MLKPVPFREIQGCEGVPPLAISLERHDGCGFYKMCVQNLKGIGVRVKILITNDLWFLSPLRLLLPSP